MSDLTKALFTHILLTAPTEEIAEVYRVQLAILQDSVPFLRGTVVNCVSDPAGQRVGSGGGTLNGLAFIRKTYNIESFDSSLVLIIHSGGESRRAPLYSLCGKAWTTINATILGGEIASPIVLLIAELTLFCANLQPGSLVVASSDVMLDITNLGSRPTDFVQDRVSLVAVPEKPTVAKNHGVVIASKEDVLAAGHPAGEVVTSQALKYLQKPSVADMESLSALYTMSSFFATPPEEETMPDDQSFALVDTGVVIFTGTALAGLVTLLHDPVISGCIAKELRREQNNPAFDTLRLELYSDLLLALSLMKQEDFELPVYLSRLGVKEFDSAPGASAYDRALKVVWETLKNIPLQLIFVPNGKFEHLGTTAEVLQLLTQSLQIPAPAPQDKPTEETSESESDKAVGAEETDEEPHAAWPEVKAEEPLNSPNPVRSTKFSKLSKLQHFAQKYRLEAAVGSRSSLHVGHAVTINSVVSGQPDPTAESIAEPTESSYMSAVLIEHSVLSGVLTLPDSAVVSHLCAPLGLNLTVRDDIMLQKVYLRCGGAGVSADLSLVPFTLLVLGIRDDVKACFSNQESTVCGSTWQILFKVAGVDPSDIWGAEVPPSERCLWNARLFCESQLDLNGAVHIYSEGSLLPASRLTLTWLQDLSALGDELSEEYALAVSQWVTARRLSLADILTRGDATRMMLWRLWLQTAHRAGYGAVGRVARARGDDQMTLDLSFTFSYLLEYGQSLGGSENDAESGHTVLLSRWLVQLVQQVPDASFQRFFSQVQALGNPGMHHVISAYLKKLVLSDKDLGAVLWQLFKTISRVSANMHSRVLFLAAWLVQGREYLANAKAFLEIFKMLSVRHEAITLSRAPASPGELEAQLKAHGEEILRLTGVAALSSVSRAEANLPEEEDLSLALERIAQGMVAFHLQSSLDAHAAAQEHVKLQAQEHQEPAAEHAEPAAQFTPKWKVSVKSQAPARIDIAGGWSDTPPICYELGGAVLNVAILVDNNHPIRCFSNMITKPILELHSQSLVGGEYVIERFTTDQSSDFDDLTRSGEDKSCLLLRAVLVALGVIGTAEGWSGPSLRNHLQAKLGGGISVTCVSDLPSGSGMGTSSILAATALHSLSALLGLPTSQDALVNLVSQVEQILTTGGGWQDQVGGIFGGFKLCQSAARLPLVVNVEKLVTSHSFNEAFHRRVWLVYTGQQRLARNTLINALRYSALSPMSSSSSSSLDSTACVGTVPALVEGAHAGWTLLQNSVAETPEETAEEQVDQLSAVLDSYWELKKEMAAGSEPAHIADMLAHLRPLCTGLSLCGAGAGGFATVILKRDVSEAALRELIDAINVSNGEDVADSEKLSVHSVTVDWIGIQSEEVAMV